MRPQIVRIEAPRDDPNTSLRSCIVYLQLQIRYIEFYARSLIQNVFLLGRDQAKCMNYINYPTIEPTTCSYTVQKN